MIIRTADTNDKQLWDDFVSARSDSSPYQLFSWKSAIEKSYGHKCIYLMALEDKELLGILPLVIINPPFKKGAMVSLPFCDIGGPLANSPDISRALIEYAIQKGREIGTATLELRLQMEEAFLQNVRIPCSVMSHKARMLLELPGSSEKLWESFRSKLRSQVRKAEKNDLAFHWGSIDVMRDFYGVFSRMREQVCTTICPYGRLQGVLLDRNSIIVAYDHERGENRRNFTRCCSAVLSHPLACPGNADRPHSSLHICHIGHGLYCLCYALA